MTKSEAVIWLEKLKGYCQGAGDWADFSKECEALDIAIEELRREQPEPPEDGLVTIKALKKMAGKPVYVAPLLEKAHLMADGVSWVTIRSLSFMQLLCQA